MPAQPELVARVNEVIREALNIDVPAPDTDLIATGLVDSLALVTLLVGLEEDLDCELPLDDFDLDRFRSAERIADFVSSLGLNGARRR